MAVQPEKFHCCPQCEAKHPGLGTRPRDRSDPLTSCDALSRVTTLIGHPGWGPCVWNSPLLPTSTAEPRTQGQMEAPKPPCPPGHSPMLAMPTSGRQRSHPSPVPAAPPRAALRLRGACPGHTAGLGGRSERKVLTPAGPSGQRTNYRVPAVLTVARSGDISSQEPRSRPTGALGLGAGHGREGRAGPSGAGRAGSPSAAARHRDRA